MKLYKKLLLKIIPFHGWRVAIRHHEAGRNILYNVFNAKHRKKRVLVSYITTPFTKGLSRAHTNFMECFTAAQIFNEMGYTVDVANWDTLLSHDEIENYDVIYGFGHNFRIACSNPKINTIFYSPGCSIDFSNIVTIQKVIDFYNATGKWCPDSARYCDQDNSVINNFAKNIIVLGNDFVKNTHNVKNRIFNLNAFYYDTYDINIDSKDFTNIKTNFLFFGSSGGLHKGLDLVIELFKKHPELNLTICGFSRGEQILYDYYKDVFTGKHKNITYYEFVDVESDDFKRIMDNNVAVITPSVSEGGAVATLMCMANGGLIPICSQSTGLNISKYGFEFNKISITEIEKRINKMLEMSESDLRNLSKKVKDETRQNYTYQNYKHNLSDIISTCLKF